MISSKKLHFVGGCMGNTTGISALVKGRNVDEVINTLKGIDCGGRGTLLSGPACSCPDGI